jgi:hypothetical protein
MTPTPQEKESAYQKGYNDGYFEGLGADNYYLKDSILYFEYENGRKDGMAAWKKKELNT